MVEFKSPQVVFWALAVTGVVVVEGEGREEEGGGVYVARLAVGGRGGEEDSSRGSLLLGRMSRF